MGRSNVSFRERARYYLDYSFTGRLWNLIDCFLNILFIISYIYQSYISIGTRFESNPPIPQHHHLLIDYLLSLLLLFNWMPNIYLSFQPLHYLCFEFFSHLTLLSALPVIYTYHYPTTHTLLLSGDLIFLYPFRCWRLHLSLLKILTPGNNQILNLSPISTKAFKLGISIFNTLLTVTSWVHICLYSVQKYYDLGFFDVFYTITVSSTSGLATQIIPDNTFSRVITLYVMIVGAIFIPRKLADLLNLINNQSAYRSPFIPSFGYNHIVVLGSFDFISLKAFLQEFFNKDHGSNALRTRIVVFSPHEPQTEIETLIKNSLYESRVTYIKGNTFSFKDMGKARIELASACFILSSVTESMDITRQDCENVMQTLALKKYNKNLDIFVQALKPESRVHLINIAKEVICIQDFKSAMVAQNCICPGTTTLIYLLTTSITDSTVKKLKNNPKFAHISWIKDYLNGCRMEIYTTPLSDSYDGLEFASAAVSIFLKHGCILLGIKTPQADNPGRTLLINPQGYVFTGGELGIFITSDSAEAYNIAQNGPHITNARDTFIGLDLVPPAVLNFEISQENLIEVSKSENIIENFPIQNNSYKDHIIVCNMGNEFPLNLSSFMRSLRARSMKMVVVLSLKSPEDEYWKSLQTFRNIKHVKGSALTLNSLISAGILKAWKVVILAREDDNINRTVDSSALLSILNIQQLTSGRPETQKIGIVVEFIFLENMKYIGKGEKYFLSDAQEHLIIPAFVSGQVFCNNIFNSMLCQIYYNNHLADILRLLVYNGRTDHLAVNHKCYLEPKSVFDSGFLSLESIPSKCIGATFSQLYDLLLTKHGKLCIGLYRFDKSVNNIWYVFLNPDKNTVLKEDDNMYVFSKINQI